MTMVRSLSAMLLVLLGAAVIARAQTLGSIDLKTFGVKINGKSGVFSRKRFYLFQGGLAANRQMLDRVKTADIKSRDCYYSEKQASPQFICWLRAENCESPYCRTITEGDIQQVPEFKAAYTKGLAQFKGLPEIARGWVTTNLPPIFTNGYYEASKSLVAKLLGDAKPLRSSMIDVKGSITTFTDIPLNFPAGKQSETFLLSNVLPLEYAGKSYVWACELEVGENKATLVLNFPNTKKTCEVYIKDLPVCKTEACPAK